MTAYYKSARLDGMSFYDGVTQWRVGRITRLEGTLGRKLCGPDVLHASIELGESLVGGSWPCRLFEVEPRGVLLTESRHPYKVGAMAWKVVAELPAWQALGPNGQQVAALIERCRTFTPDEAHRWDAAWDAAGDAARDAAWVAAWVAAGALVVRDLITAEHFATLTAPWVSVMGEVS